MKNIYLYLVLFPLFLPGLESCTKRSQAAVTPSDPVDSIVGQYIGIYNSIEIDGDLAYKPVYDTLLNRYPVVFSIVKNGKDSFQITGNNFSPSSYAYSASNSYEIGYTWPGNVVITPATGSFHMHGGMSFLSGTASLWVSDTINATKVK